MDRSIRWTTTRLDARWRNSPFEFCFLVILRKETLYQLECFRGLARAICSQDRPDCIFRLCACSDYGCGERCSGGSDGTSSDESISRPLSKPKSIDAEHFRHFGGFG